MKLHEMTARELASALEAGEVSAVEVTQAFFERIDAVDDQVGAYLTLTRESALRQAEEADIRRKRGEDVPPLLGVPIALKDNLCTDGVRTTCASRMLEHFVPPYDATVVTRLKEAGMPILGKTNMDEFALGSSTEYSALKKTRNPWNLQRVPGGSSGGSAAAVAASLAPLALGTDTGGSIRQPAAFCGIVGMKPTYGLVSRFGLVAAASSLDQIGTMTKDVADTALLLNVIAGYDPYDSTSVKREIPDYFASLESDVSKLRIGMPVEFFAADIHPEVRAAIEAAVKRMEALGAEVVEVKLPHSAYALSAYYVIASAELSSNLGRFDGVRYGHRANVEGDVFTMFRHSRSEGFGPEVKRRILLGTYVLLSGNYRDYYLQAMKVRALIAKDFEQAFQQCDVIVAPATANVAFPFDGVPDPAEMHALDLFTVPVNLAGLPAISLPCGLNSEGMPIGMQLIGPTFGEVQLLQAAYALEQEIGPLPKQPQLEVESND